MWRHRTDVVAFCGATFFLVCAALAVGVRTGNLGLGPSASDGAWIGGTVLAVAGVIGVLGTMSTLRRHRSDTTPGAPSPEVDRITTDEPDEPVDPGSELA